MKNKIYYILILTLVAFTSCGDYEPTIYNPDTDQTLAFFPNATLNLEVIINETADLDVEVGVSTLSSSDRTINIAVDTEASSATPGQYSVPSTVTIPANQFFGTFTITGIDDGLETDGVTLDLLLNADGIANTAASGQAVSITIKEICPVDGAFFMGMYEINQLTGVGPFASIQSILDTQTVEVVMGDGSTARSFDFLYSPSTFASDFNMSLNLVCGFVEGIDGAIQTGSLSCDGGATQIGQANSSTLSPYDIADDSSFRIFINDFIAGADGGCGVTPYEIEFTMTKL